jgi:dynein heavy chain, axonemal
MVERWLIEVEQTMVDSVRMVIGKSVESYASKPRRQWVLQWPGQVVICVSSIYWTTEVSEAVTVKDGIQVNYVVNLLSFIII